MNALELVKEICRTVSQPVPVTIANANDTNTQYVLACLNRAAAKAAREYRWAALQKDVTFPASVNHDAYDPASGGLVLSKIAPDYAYPVTAALYETDSLEPVSYAGPDDFKRLSLYGGAGERYFTVFGGKLFFLPALTQNPVKINLQYVGKYAVVETENNSNRFKASFEKDTDESPLDDELLILGAVLKYKSELGLAYDDAENDYQTLLCRLKNTDTALPVLRPGHSVAFRPGIVIPGTSPVE